MIEVSLSVKRRTSSGPGTRIIRHTPARDDRRRTILAVVTRTTILILNACRLVSTASGRSGLQNALHTCDQAGIGKRRVRIVHRLDKAPGLLVVQTRRRTLGSRQFRSRDRQTVSGDCGGRAAAQGTIDRRSAGTERKRSRRTTSPEAVSHTTGGASGAILVAIIVDSTDDQIRVPWRINSHPCWGPGLLAAAAPLRTRRWGVGNSCTRNSWDLHPIVVAR
jgi:hypothetical protein